MMGDGRAIGGVAETASFLLRQHVKRRPLLVAEVKMGGDIFGDIHGVKPYKMRPVSGCSQIGLIGINVIKKSILDHAFGMETGRPVQTGIVLQRLSVRLLPPHIGLMKNCRRQQGLIHAATIEALFGHLQSLEFPGGQTEQLR